MVYGYYCHYVNKYRDAPDSVCNLRYKLPKEVSMVLIMTITS